MRSFFIGVMALLVGSCSPSMSALKAVCEEEAAITVYDFMEWAEYQSEAMAMVAAIRDTPKDQVVSHLHTSHFTWTNEWRPCSQFPSNDNSIPVCSSGKVYENVSLLFRWKNDSFPSLSGDKRMPIAKKVSYFIAVQTIDHVSLITCREVGFSPLVKEASESGS